MGTKVKKAAVLDGFSLTLEDTFAIANGCKVEIHRDAEKRIAASWKLVDAFAKSRSPTYGINTGFGYLAREKISSQDLDQLQINLVKSHASGYGNPLSIRETRLAMALRLNVLLRGNSGVHFQLCESLCGLINNEIYPVIPEYGSVGASGDLAPLAHLALPLIGEGEVFYKNKVVPAAKALKQVKLKPYKLSKKEGLALINGTQIMLAVGTLPYREGLQLLELADRVAALTFEGLTGIPTALDNLIHQARGHPGQIASAQKILESLQGSYLFDKKTKRIRVQDPYSLRCSPQVHGPAREAFGFVGGILQREWNASTDNPLVFSDEEKIISGGNFHGQYLAMAFDIASLSLAEIGSISERRLELLLNPHKSGLPAFLVPKNGINSGYMASQYLSASLVNENKLLANPSCTDSIPGNVGIEDHVSMGMTSARKFRKIVENVRVILAVELLAAAQAVDLRGVKKLGKGSRELYDSIRKKVPMLSKDRVISEDVKKASNVLQDLYAQT